MGKARYVEKAAAVVEGWHRLVYSRWIAEGLLYSRQVFYCPARDVEVVRVNSTGWTVIVRGAILPKVWTTARAAMLFINDQPGGQRGG